jgi:outer membrane protein
MSGLRQKGWTKAAAIVISLVASGFAPQAARSENLADALIGAYNTSGLLEQNRALLRAADENVAVSVSSLRPVIDFILSARQTESISGSTALTGLSGTSASAQIAAAMTIYDGGARILGIQSAQENVLATRQGLVSIEQFVLLRAVAAYVDVLQQSENVRLGENNVRVLSEELRASQDRFDVGEVTRTDVALAESRLAAARGNLAAVRGALVNAAAEYTSAVGRAPGTLAGQPALPARPASIKAAQDVAVRNHPDILAAQHQVAAAEFTIRQLEKGLGPTATVNAQVGTTSSSNFASDGQDASVSLQLSQPIYQGGRLASQVRAAMAQRDAARGNLLNVQKTVVQDVNDAFVALEVARASLVARAEQVRAARVAFEGIREEATLGARTTLDVLTAEQELLDALTEQISAQSNQSLAAYQLLSSQGLLTAERLGLAVQIYDPTIYYNLVKDAPAARSKQSRDLDRVLEALGKR